jgi:hypothetical protein
MKFQVSLLPTMQRNKAYNKQINFAAVSTTALGPTQPPIQWALSLWVKRLEPEADYSPPSSPERMREALLQSPNTPSWRGAQLSTGTILPFTFTFTSKVISGSHHPFGHVIDITLR